MSKKPKPAPPDQDALVEVASMLTLAHVQVARAVALARQHKLEGIVTAAGMIAADLRREITVAMACAIKGDG